MKEAVFLTGASGFVGGAIARAMRQSAQPRLEVRAMSRSTQSDRVLSEIGATPVRCELGAVRTEHLEGCGTVVHCAAFVKQWGTREQFWSANVTGTEQLLRVAREAGVRRFIHLGTEAALFRGQHMRDIDESYPYPASTPFLYSETKAAAERRVLAANAPGFTTLSIRPRGVWGPGDQTLLPAIVKMVRSGRFMWIDGGRAWTSTTHIDNVVHGVLLALQNGRGGEAYFVIDAGAVTLREFVTALLATHGLVPPDRSMPAAIARSLAAAAETLWRIFGIESDPPLTRLAAAFMSCDCTIRSDKARHELKYEPIVTRAAGLSRLKDFHGACRANAHR